MPPTVALARNVGLYVHLPFCRQRCIYCDFPTQIGSDRDLDAYLPLLEREMDLYADQGLSAATVFFGGGTPSLLRADQFEQLMATIRRRFPLAPAAEVTLEANPGTVSDDQLAAFRQAGLNRLSLGAQTFNPHLLTVLNRLHGPEAIGEAVAMARRAGIDEINIDLIYGLPGQTLADWQDTVEKALTLQLPHHSLYPLTVETGTPLEAMVKKGKLLPGAEAEAMAMYDWSKQRLEAAGYHHYEIANFARPGHEARHNRIYWRYQPYLGLGMGAHSLFAGRRYGNPPTLDAYRERVLAGDRPWQTEAAADHETEMEEFTFLNLRLLVEGLDPDEFAARFEVPFATHYAPQLAALTDEGLIERHDDGRWRLTSKAIPIAHEVFVHFMQ